MKKRFVALLLAIMTATSLTACGNAGGQAAPANYAPTAGDASYAYEPVMCSEEADMGSYADFEYSYEMNSLIADGGEFVEEFNTEEYLSIKIVLHLKIFIRQFSHIDSRIFACFDFELYNN